MTQNYYICLEGLDCIGKTTVCSKIIKFLKCHTKRPILFMTRPDKLSKIGSTLYNEAKKVPEGSISRCLLFMANNAVNFNNKVLPWMKKHKNGIIIADRFLLSMLTYNVIDTHLENSIDSILELESGSCNQHLPDICFYLYSESKNLDPYSALKNRKYKLEENDLKCKKFKLKLLEKYEKAISYYNFNIGSQYHIQQINIDNPEFMDKIYKELKFRLSLA